MAQIGGPNSNFEKLLKDSLKTLDSQITYRTNRITTILTNALNKPNVSAAYWRKAKADLTIQYNALDSLYKTWANKNIPTAYKASMKELFTRLNRSKAIASKAKKSYIDLVTSSKSTVIESILVKDALADWTASLTSGQARIERLLRKTQQTLLLESQVDASVIKALQSGNLMNNTFIKSMNMSDTLAGLLNELAETVDGEKYVYAGSRRFKPKYYAEMVTRVKFHEAQAQASIQTAGNYGTSLVQVSSHNTRTAICAPYEGRIFSIGGKDSRFPFLDAVPPYHVNCLHLLFPMFESAMEVDGTLSKWVEFSNGSTPLPPSPVSFVPLSERGLK